MVINGVTQKTDTEGVTSFAVAPDPVEIVIVKNGFAPASASVDVAANQRRTIALELNRTASIEEHVTVAATRTDRGIEDQPMRVEVVDRGEIDEKAMMTPGDVVMLLNETGGMRVQATSPSRESADANDEHWHRGGRDLEDRQLLIRRELRLRSVAGNRRAIASPRTRDRQVCLNRPMEQ